VREACLGVLAHCRTEPEATIPELVCGACLAETWRSRQLSSRRVASEKASADGGARFEGELTGGTLG
jgi:hypothetical protein